MSDLLIRNIELPKAFQRLRLTIMPDGSVSIVNSFNEAVVPTEAKAEILPDHGDLIDRDALWGSTMCPYITRKPLFDAPVVIPKSGS